MAEQSEIIESESDARARREREEHNRFFSEGTRVDVSRFYSVSASMSERYHTLLLKDAAGKRVLEYGCGVGSAAFDLARAGATVTGIDISDVAIEQAKETAMRDGVSDRTTFLQMNAEQTSFADHSFDLICGSAILHHLDLRRAYSEIRRLLRRDGTAIFAEPLGHNPAINLYRKMTPSVRTVDEHPLLVADLKLAEEYFAQVEGMYFNLASIAAVPLRSVAAFPRILAALETVDRMMFRVPLFRKHAWYVVLEFSKPKAVAASAEAAARVFV